MFHQFESKKPTTVDIMTKNRPREKFEPTEPGILDTIVAAGDTIIDAGLDAVDATRRWATLRWSNNTLRVKPGKKSLSKAVIEAEKALDDRGRVLLRKSGTEPLVRVMVEANDAQDSSTWAEHIANAVRKVTN